MLYFIEKYRNGVKKSVKQDIFGSKCIQGKA